MTLLILGAIFCVLVAVARELRLLRKQRETPPISAEQRQQTSAKYKPRIFTFSRSGWALRIVDLDEWVGILATVVIWFKFVLPLLPAQPWIKYPITIVGLLIFSFVATMAVEILDPLHGWMEKYDERVYQRVFSAEERKELELIRNSDWCACTDDIEEQSRRIRLEREQIEQIYRQKGL
jgi:hypothetical protein